MSTLLPVMILLPLATAVVVMLLRSAGAARWISLLGSLATLAVSLVLTAQFTLAASGERVGGRTGPAPRRVPAHLDDLLLGGRQDEPASAPDSLGRRGGRGPSGAAWNSIWAWTASACCWSC